MIGKYKKGFTLVEMVVVVAMFAIILVIAFEAMGNIAFFRTRLSSRLDIEQDLYYAVENLSSVIKDFGGDIDYEEYWDRQMMGTTVGSGHYSNYTGFGNYGSGGAPGGANYGYGPYLCRSGSGVAMGFLGCSNTGTINNAGIMNGQPQRYGEYALQFIDYNNNANIDLGDENGDSFIVGDNDDENLGKGPEAFSGNMVNELYLIKKGKKNERMLFRLNIIQDPNSSNGCNFSNGTGSGCLGKIQYLKLKGFDYGYDHVVGGSLDGELDGKIDTRKCDEDFYCNFQYRIPQKEEGWVDLLPSYINVKNIKFYIYPKKDHKLAWGENASDITINPYVRINITLGYSRSRRNKVKGINPEINLTTTINLTKN